jgi:hypothetical protein
MEAVSHPVHLVSKLASELKIGPCLQVPSALGGCHLTCHCWRSSLAPSSSAMRDRAWLLECLVYYVTQHRHRVQLVRRVAQEPSVRGSNPSGARVQWNEGCAEPSVGGSNPYEME